MLNNKFIYIVAGVAMLAASCKNEELAENYNLDDVVFNASFGENVASNELKTTLQIDNNTGKYVGSWNVNDTVLIYDGTNAVKFFSNAAGPVKATLKRAPGQPSFTQSNDYLVYYPGENASYNGNGGFDVTLPATQYYNADGTVSDDAYPMMAKSNNLNLPFYNLCTVLKVVVRCEVPTTITKLMFRSWENNVSGKGIATFADETPVLDMGVLATTNSSVTLDCGEGVEVGPEGQPFYIVLPVGTYKSGTFKNGSKDQAYNMIYAQVKNVGTFQFSLSMDLDMQRSKVYKYDAVQYVNIGTGTLGSEGDNVD